jgi:tRNA(Ile)-lysidine synthase
MGDWSLLHAKIHQTLRERRLVQSQQRLLVAVSGGQDSVCLLKLIYDLKPLWRWECGVIHCDHQWRQDSGENATFVQHWVEGLGLPFHGCQADHALPSEAAARQWRYHCFNQIALAHSYQGVLTGHTATDRAETVLYNLMRGCGGDGLGTLPWSRPLDSGSDIQMIRPLLEVQRQDTAQFCQGFNLPIWEDSTNADRRYTRNRIRLDLLPYLQQEFNPQVVLHLTRTAELLQEDGDYLEQQATHHRQQIQHKTQLHRPALKPLHLSLQRRILRQFLQEHLPHHPTFVQIEKLVRLIDAPQGSQTDPFPGGTMAQVVGEWILLKHP